MHIAHLIPMLCLWASPFALHANQGGEANAPLILSDYYLTLAFRESPYAPHKGLHRISADRALSINHYRFDHSEDGRLIGITFALGDQQRRQNHTANYFWYASAERYEYRDDQVFVTYLDEWGEPTTVRGEVAVSVYRLDQQGRRIELSYLGVEGAPVNNDWGIHRYHWRHLDDGSVIETRYDLDGGEVPIRPGFEFKTIRLSYDANGFTRLMQRVDDGGQLVGEAGEFAQDRFTYSPGGGLVQYDVLDAKGAPAGNHQDISSGLLTFTAQGYEHIASYQGADGNPARTDHGWWQSERAYDRFGNLTLNAFQSLDGSPRDNPKTGYATAVIEWHDDGMRRKSMRYFDESGKATNHSGRGYHAVFYDYDENGRALEQRYTTDELKAQRLMDALNLLQAMSKVPGMAAAIAMDGEVVWHGEAGYANLAQKTPVTADTVFRLASTSKAVTSVLAARALEDGQITLDTQAADLLSIDHDATLGQLLSHTGSVDHYRATISVDLDRQYPSSIDALATVEPHILQQPPGSQYVYSTFGYTLAGAMLETASGASLPAMLATLVADTGTLSLAAPINEATVNGLTRFYEISAQPGNEPVPARPRNFSYGYAGAGMVANASDLAGFMSLFAAGRLVGTEWQELMLTPATLTDGNIVRDRNYEVALGWRRQAGPQGRIWYHHAGVTDGARAIVAIDPERAIAVSILSNASWTSDMFGTAITLANLFTNEPRASDALHAPAVEFEGEAHLLAFDECTGVTCIWRGHELGALGLWLSKGGRGSGLVLGDSAGSRYLGSPYGISWLAGGVGGIGSRTVRLEAEEP